MTKLLTAASRIVHAETAYNAMLAVDRADFCPRSPYQDSPQGIGYNATISAPHMHAYALDRLSGHLKEGARVLDVGCGSGYLTVAMSLMCGATGYVVGIDHIDELVQLSRGNIEKHHSDLLNSKRIELVVGDGRKGWPIPGGYNAIHVGAAAPQVPPELLEQLADGGRMLIPVGTESQEYLQIDRNGSQFIRKKVYDVIYVPLTSKEEQLSKR